MANKVLNSRYILGLMLNFVFAHHFIAKKFGRSIVLYISLRHDVDFVTLKDSGAFVCTEMKFRLKPNSYGPFSNAKLFIDKIAVKFDELELALAKDAEEFVKVRVLLVSDGHFDLLRSAIEDLKNAGDVCSSDGCRHDYLLCTLSGLFKLSANNTEAGETFKFSL